MYVCFLGIKIKVILVSNSGNLYLNIKIGIKILQVVSKNQEAENVKDKEIKHSEADARKKRKKIKTIKFHRSCTRKHNNFVFMFSIINFPSKRFRKL